MYKILSKRNSSASGLSKKLFWLVLFILQFISPLSASANEHKVELPKNPTAFDSVTIEGMHLFQYQDLAYIFEPYQGKTIEDEATFHAHVVRSVNQHYLTRGFIFSMVSNCEIHEHKLHIEILEGSINEIVIQKEIEYITEVPYIKDYIAKLKSIKPFNTHEAEKYFQLMTRLLGKDLKITPIFLNHDNIDTQDPKTIDLFLSDYKKVRGTFEINNNYKNNITASNSDAQNTDITQSSGYFTMGGLRTRINNPFNTPANINTYLSSSGDKKENILFASYTHQINPQGTQLKLSTGFDQYDFTKRHKRFFTATTGVSHPVLLTNNQQLDIFTNLQFYTLDKKYHQNFNTDDLTSTDPFTLLPALKIALQNRQAIKLNNRSDVWKIAAGTNYQARIWGANSNSILQAHFGKNKLRYPNDSSKNLHDTFSKVTFEAHIEYPLPKDFSISLNVDTQYSNSKNLPIDEYFFAGNAPGGRGFLPSKILGKGGIQGSLMLSHIDRTNHPLLFAFNEYIYVDTAKASKAPQSASGTTISSVGIGVDAYLVDNLIVNLELNKPIKAPKANSYGLDNSSNSKKVKLFAGLKYMFSF